LIERVRALLLRRFFERRILPLAASVEPEPAGPGDVPSYYVPRTRAPLGPADLRIPFRDRREIAASLDAHWAHTPLRGLGSAIVRLSRAFGGVRAKERVSSFIYEMF